MRKLEHLGTWLRSYRPADAAEAAHLAQMQTLWEQNPASWQRDEFVPGHFTASAFLTCPQLDRLLLIFHPKLHRWLQPGGHLEAADAGILAAAERELREETGLTHFALHPACPGIFDVDVHEIPARKNEPAHLHLDVRFLFVTTGAEEVKTEAQIEAFAWVTLSEAMEKSDASVARAAHKLRRLALDPSWRVESGA